jgi:hypothetical protein
LRVKKYTKIKNNYLELLQFYKIILSMMSWLRKYLFIKIKEIYVKKKKKIILVENSFFYQKITDGGSIHIGK